MSNTLALNMTDDSHHGRVQSLMMLSFAGFGIAAAPLGLLAEWVGLRPAIMLMGLAALLAVVIYALMEHRMENEIGRGPVPQTVEVATLDLPKWLELCLEIHTGGFFPSRSARVGSEDRFAVEKRLQHLSAADPPFIVVEMAVLGMDSLGIGLVVGALGPQYREVGIE